eukprot:11201758-Lingulodinium_polyedra.AAC.1
MRYGQKGAAATLLKWAWEKSIELGEVAAGPANACRGTIDVCMHVREGGSAHGEKGAKRAVAATAWAVHVHA